MILIKLLSIFLVTFAFDCQGSEKQELEAGALPVEGETLDDDEQAEEAAAEEESPNQQFNDNPWDPRR